MPELIRRDRIHPNDWNANAFDPENYPKLVASIREKGILEPLKVMPDPEHPDDFLMVDGYHRWMAAEELGIDEVPCDVWEITVEEAKIRGLQLNYLRGQPVPRRLAELLHDLSRTYTSADLAGLLPWTPIQIDDSLEMLKLPTDLEARIRQQVSDEAANAPHPVTVTLVGAEFDIYQRAMESAKRSLGKGTRVGQHLAKICATYLDAQGEHDFDAEPDDGVHGGQDEAQDATQGNVGQP